MIGLIINQQIGELEMRSERNRRKMEGRVMECAARYLVNNPHVSAALVLDGMTFSNGKLVRAGRSCPLVLQLHSMLKTHPAIKTTSKPRKGGWTFACNVEDYEKYWGAI